MTRGRLDWDTDGRDWPNRDASRFVTAGGLRWHVQQFGSGPVLLLLHGTGASTHSYRDLAPALATSFRVIVPDLPGHGFTDGPPGRALTLPGMATALGALLDGLDVQPDVIVGHSAGAALAVEMALDGLARPRLIVALNGAMLPFGGLGRHLFPSLAKLLFLNGVTPHVFAWRAQDSGAVKRVLEGTGSPIDATGVALYARLFRSAPHVAATLAMMANWDLNTFERRLPTLASKLVLVAASNDRAVPADTAFDVRDLVPGSDVRLVRGLGHLAHEEAPIAIAALIREIAEQAKAA